MNTGHIWSIGEHDDLIKMDRQEFLAKYPDISEDAARHRFAKLSKTTGTDTQNAPTGVLEREPFEYSYTEPSQLSPHGRAMFIGDTHGIFVNEASFSAALNFMHDFKPTDVFLMGDMVDFYDVSTFRKDPNRRVVLAKEIEFTKDVIFNPIRKTAPKASITYLEGNHEARLQKYLWGRAPELASLGALNVQSLFGLPKFKFEYATEATYGNFFATHGHMVQKHSGWTARAMLEQYNVNTIIGHTHRLGAFYRTDKKGTLIGFENGCLCEFEMEYVSGIANWQHGFSYGYLGDHTINIHQVLITADGFVGERGNY